MTRTSHSLRLAVLLGTLAVPMTACIGAGTNTGMQSVHQPVVSHTNFIFDVAGDESNGMSPAEKERLNGWLDSIEVGYGDRVAIANDGGHVSPATRQSIADVLGHRGMLIDEDSSAEAGKAPYGAVRLIVRRASASVPGCPDWKDKQEATMSNGVSRNYGCATNGNLAAMIANPDDLVRGQSTNSDLRTATSNMAIKTYREKAPTGSGALGGN